MNSAERWVRTEQIFNEAVSAGEPERTKILESRCAGDLVLMAELRNLLKACEAEERHRGELRSDKAAEPGLNTRVGPYVIDRLLGRGGMGAVYLAHRVDGQFSQQVAIKVIDLPLATDFFRERFRAERQILAGLSHPYIARLLDGGVTEEGDLYLAMEYIEGVSITRFCEERRLSLRERVMLFRKVCEAVQYAHQNLVVHRDLKPDNILVVADGTPRLLDFGTAKILTPPASAGGTELTRPGMQTFTPQYASPEQVLGRSISTASDTYSLGVLLYLLLTGRMPYEFTDFTTEEMVQVICQQQPVKPGGPGSLFGKLDADLTSIVLMALRKEPEQRYSSVEYFSADLQAWLDFRPVSARRGDFRYRAGRFVYRNKFAFGGASLLAVTGIAGVAGIVSQAHVATVERHKAEMRSEDMRQLSVSFLTELDEAIKQLPGSTSAQKILVTRVLEHLDRSSAEGTNDKLTDLNLADAYTRVANLEGNPYEQNIGDAAGGLASVARAVKLTEHLKDVQPTDAEVLHAYALAKQSQSEILYGMGKTREAVDAMRVAAATYGTLASSASAKPEQMSDASSAYGGLGDELGKSGNDSLGDTAGALAAYLTALEYQKKALQLDPKWPRSLRTLPIAMLKIGSMEMGTDPWKAVRQLRACVEAMDRYPAAEKNGFNYKRNYAYVQRNLGDGLIETGQYTQAEEAIEPTLPVFESFLKADPQDTRSRIDLVSALDSAARLYEAMIDEPQYIADRETNRRKAEQLLTRMSAVLEDLVKKNPSDTFSRQNLARTQVRIGTLQQHSSQHAQGALLAARGIGALKELAKAPGASTYIYNLLTNSLLWVEPASLRNPELAVKYAEMAVAQSPRKPTLWCDLAHAYRAAGAPAAVRREAAQKGLALLAPVKPDEPRTTMRKQLESEAR